MRIQLDASLQEFRFTSDGREVRFRPVLWVAGKQVLSVGEPPAGQTDDTGIRIFAQPHPDAMELLGALLRYGVQQFRTTWNSREINLTRLCIRVGKDVNQHLSGFAVDVFAMAGKHSDAARVRCVLAE
ncbi:MAG: hypothetical protein U1F77_19030 [Kiritimatiellia bacterium]